ncbi:hypothetical protein DMENIID0001_091960 [Sergentomyia squamirostris]
MSFLEKVFSVREERIDSLQQHQAGQQGLGISDDSDEGSPPHIQEQRQNQDIQDDGSDLYGKQIVINGVTYRIRKSTRNSNGFNFSAQSGANMEQNNEQPQNVDHEEESVQYETNVPGDESYQGYDGHGYDPFYQPDLSESIPQPFEVRSHRDQPTRPTPIRTTHPPPSHLRKTNNKQAAAEELSKTCQSLRYMMAQQNIMTNDLHNYLRNPSNSNFNIGNSTNETVTIKKIEFINFVMSFFRERGENFLKVFFQNLENSENSNN